jgi:hypothetical protein
MTKNWGWPKFALLLVVQLWVAHAIAFFAHEYAHAFVAWVLGWKTNPLALDYAHPSLVVFLIQSGINQNVDNARILAAGHGVQLAAIAAAGALLGNGFITYPLSCWAMRAARRAGSRGWAMLAYWLCVASVGNLIDYVPIRTFTDGTDLTTDTLAVELGLGWSPWVLLVVFGIPALAVLAYFLARLEPKMLGWLFPESAAKRGVMAAVTAFALFAFDGAAGLGSGPVSHRMSVVSACVVAPVMMAAGVWFNRKSKNETGV